MNWTLFMISAAIWVFFTEHHIWTMRFKQMSEAGLEVPSQISSASNLLGNIAALNLVIFFFVYGFRVSWLWGAVTVFGAYLVGLVYMLVSARHHGTFLHKIGWVAMPALSVAIWVAAFVA